MNRPPDSTPSESGSDSEPPRLGLADVRKAAETIRGRVVHTPVLRCEALESMVGCELWLKTENFQRIGAFKARGAMYAVSRLEPAERERGVITYSSGNHAQAVALAAREFGVQASVAMPVDAPRIKVEGVRALGGEVTFAGTTSTDRRTAALEIQSRTGGVIISPFDSADIVAGQGTATLEFHAQVEEQTGGKGLDVLIVPVGGGGVIAGACVASEGRDVKVCSVEPVGCDALAQSLEQGTRVSVEPGPTLADGLKPVQVGALNFELARRRVTNWYRVTDDELGPALVRLAIRAKLVVEPSAAAGLAVALRGPGEGDRAHLPGRPRRIGVLLTGGNIEPEQLAQLVGRFGGQA